MKQQVGAAIPPQWWDRLRGAQFGFVAGLLIGLVLGWIFHGVISLAVRFGILLLLLLPLIVIGWLWFRSQRGQARRPDSPRQGTSASWTAVIDVERAPPPSQEPPTSPLVDVPLMRPTAERPPVDIEAELDALKQQRERGT